MYTYICIWYVYQHGVSDISRYRMIQAWFIILEQRFLSSDTCHGIYLHYVRGFDCVESNRNQVAWCEDNMSHDLVAHEEFNISKQFKRAWLSSVLTGMQEVVESCWIQAAVCCFVPACSEANCRLPSVADLHSSLSTSTIAFPSWSL